MKNVVEKKRDGFNININLDYKNIQTQNVETSSASNSIS